MNKALAVLALVGAVFAGVVSIAQDKPKQAELVAMKVEKAPELKAELNDVWKATTPVTVGTRYSREKPGPQVELRALHDGENIWFMARWQDETKSETKKAWEFNEGKWAQAEGDEDRFAVAINNNVEGFAEKGCAALCHDGAMTTNIEGQTADLWHWKAARGGQNGVCDDQHFNGEVEGRKDDEGKGAYTGNANEDKTAPKWVWKLKAETTGAFTEEAAREIPDDFKFEDGYSVPSNLLRKPEGSRGDIEAASEYKDGWWTVVLKRKLDTGNKDDAALKAGEATHIAVAMFNNTGAKTGKEHAKSSVIKLSLE
ncbi:MAG: hypothetical protein K8I27_06660 [Planctomycetes bacterium]|nr:hypothetical protein [Planctomycetota bacterium]